VNRPTRFLEAFVAFVLLLGGFSSLFAQQESTLRVLKRAYPSLDGTVFSFTLDGPSGTQAFGLLADQSRQFTLEPGTYTLREDVPEDW
jgi:hypothetical protein